MKGVDVLRDSTGWARFRSMVPSRSWLTDISFGSAQDYDDLTRDRYGNVVGRGNVLASLLR